MGNVPTQNVYGLILWSCFLPPSGSSGQQMLRFSLDSKNVKCCQASKHTYLVNMQGRSVLLHFGSDFGKCT